MSRRALLGRAAAAGAGAVVASAGLREAIAAPNAGRRFAAIRFQGVSGEINDSYPDELGRKPPYVDKAAEAVRTANPGATVNVDLQKIGSDDFYTKLLLALDAGDAPDVFHVGGDAIGELADGLYIAPLDEFTAKWEDVQYYPDSVCSGVTYKGQFWAIPYGLDTRFHYYRKDRLQEAGLPADWQPANVQGIIAAAVALKTAGKAIPYALYAGQASGGGAADHGFV